MEDGVFGDKPDGVDRDPLPEDDILGQVVCLHLGLHLNIEYLQSLASCVRICFLYQTAYNW